MKLRFDLGKKAFGSIQFLKKAVGHYNILHQFEKFLPKDKRSSIPYLP